MQYYEYFLNILGVYLGTVGCDTALWDGTSRFQFPMGLFIVFLFLAIRPTVLWLWYLP